MNIPLASKVFSLLLCLEVFSPLSAPAENQTPPPVDIVFEVANTAVNFEKILGLKVTPQQDLHAQISIFIPLGVNCIFVPEMIVIPVRASGIRHPYFQEIIFKAGPLNANQLYEFHLPITLVNQNIVNFEACVKGLSLWGVKKKTLLTQMGGQST